MTPQEALNVVNERFDYINEELHPNKHYQKPQFSLDILQELIDNYEKSLRLCVMETRDKVILKKELELYKKAFEQSCKDKAFIDIDQHTTQDFMDMYLNYAREELENGN